MDTPKFYFTDIFNEFEPLFKAHGIGRKTFPKGSIIFSSDQPLEFCLYIEKGLTSYSVMHESGAEKTLFYHGEGSLFPTYSSPRRYRIGEINTAITEVTGIVILQKNLKELIAGNADLMKRVLDTYLDMFNFLLFDSINQCYSSAYVRLCNFLYLYMEYLEGIGEDGSVICFTQEELARIIAVSRVQISAIFNTLRTQRIIRTNRGKIQILDKQLLADQCSGEALREYN